MNDLLSAAKEGNLKKAQEAVDSGIEVNAYGGEGEDWRAIHYAAYYGHLNVVKFLAEKKADLVKKDKDDNSPLDLAKTQNHQKIANFLEREIASNVVIQQEKEHQQKKNQQESSKIQQKINQQESSKIQQKMAPKENKQQHPKGLISVNKNPPGLDKKGSESPNAALKIEISSLKLRIQGEIISELKKSIPGFDWTAFAYEMDEVLQESWIRSMIDTIECSPDPPRALFKVWSTKKSYTVDNLLKILKNMGHEKLFELVSRNI